MNSWEKNTYVTAMNCLFVTVEIPDSSDEATEFRDSEVTKQLTAAAPSSCLLTFHSSFLPGALQPDMLFRKTLAFHD